MKRSLGLDEALSHLGCRVDFAGQAKEKLFTLSEPDVRLSHDAVFRCFFEQEVDQAIGPGQFLDSSTSSVCLNIVRERNCELVTPIEQLLRGSDSASLGVFRYVRSGMIANRCRIVIRGLRYNDSMVRGDDLSTEKALLLLENMIANATRFLPFDSDVHIKHEEAFGGGHITRSGSKSEFRFSYALSRDHSLMERVNEAITDFKQDDDLGVSFSFTPKDCEFYTPNPGLLKLLEDVETLSNKLSDFPAVPVRELQSEAQILLQGLQEGNDSLTDAQNSVQRLVRRLQDESMVFTSSNSDKGDLPFLMQVGERYLKINPYHAFSLESREEADIFTAEADSKTDFYLRQKDGRYLGLQTHVLLHGAVSKARWVEDKTQATICRFERLRQGLYCLYVGRLILACDGALVANYHDNILRFTLTDIWLESLYGRLDSSHLASGDGDGGGGGGGGGGAKDPLPIVEKTRFLGEIPSLSDHKENGVFHRFVISQLPRFSALQDQPLTFVLGAPGSGRSTVINLLLGQKLYRQASGGLSVRDRSKPFAAMSANHFGKGYTDFPSLFHTDGIALCDTPALLEQSLDKRALDALTMRLVQASIRFIGGLIVVISSVEFNSARMAPVISLLKVLASMGCSDHFITNNLYFVINNVDAAKRLDKEAVRAHFRDVNTFFSKRDDAARLLNLLSKLNYEHVYVWNHFSDCDIRQRLLADLEQVQAVPASKIRFNSDPTSMPVLNHLTRVMERFLMSRIHEIRICIDEMDQCADQHGAFGYENIGRSITDINNVTDLLRCFLEREREVKTLLRRAISHDNADLVRYQRLYTRRVQYRCSRPCHSAHSYLTEYDVQGLTPPFVRLVALGNTNAPYWRGDDQGLPRRLRQYGSWRRFILDNTFINPDYGVAWAKYRNVPIALGSFPSMAVTEVRGIRLHHRNSLSEIQRQCSGMLASCESVLSHFDTWLSPLSSGDVLLFQDDRDHSHGRSMDFVAFTGLVRALQRYFGVLVSDPWNPDDPRRGENNGVFDRFRKELIKARNEALHYQINIDGGLQFDVDDIRALHGKIQRLLDRVSSLKRVAIGEAEGTRPVEIVEFDGGLVSVRFAAFADIIDELNSYRGRVGVFAGSVQRLVSLGQSVDSHSANELEQYEQYGENVLTILRSVEQALDARSRLFTEREEACRSVNQSTFEPITRVLDWLDSRKENPDFLKHIHKWRLEHPNGTFSAVYSDLLYNYERSKARIEVFLESKRPLFCGLVVSMLKAFSSAFKDELGGKDAGASFDRVASRFKHALRVAYGERSGVSEMGVDLGWLSGHPSKAEGAQFVKLNWPGWQAEIMSFYQGMKGFCHAVAGQIMHDHRLKICFFRMFNLYAANPGELAVTLWNRLSKDLSKKSQDSVNALSDRAIIRRFIGEFPGIGVMAASGLDHGIWGYQDVELLVPYVSLEQGEFDSVSLKKMKKNCLAIVRLAQKDGCYHSIWAHPFVPGLESYPNTDVQLFFSDYPEYSYAMERFVGTPFIVESSSNSLLISFGSLSERSTFFSEEITNTWSRLTNDFIEWLGRDKPDFSAELIRPSNKLSITGPWDLRFNLFARLWVQNGLNHELKSGSLDRRQLDPPGGGGGGGGAAPRRLTASETVQQSFECKIM